MSSTDDRIVRMQFDNATFKQRAMETMKSLAGVNKAVDSAGKGKGLLDLNSNIQRVQVSASNMATITTTALATVTAKAVDSGLQLANSLTLDPIKQGFLEYESLLTKQNVIMNATGKSGKEVKMILNELNTYSDQTIYSFGNMTDAIQKFVNAGVPLEEATVSIKGIANAAAFAGANSEEANRAMYAFSQSMSLGFIGLQDWNQIENANMGTIKFKEQLLQAAEAVGTLTAKGEGYVTKNGTYVSATKGWRDGLQEQWATTKVLNKALGEYADNTTKLGKKAFESATKVRTFSAFMDTLKESIGSGWSQIFTAMVGGLKPATLMWTHLSSAVGDVVGRFFTFATATLRTWRNMGGFLKIAQAVRNVVAPFKAIFFAIGTAFKSAFPRPGRGAGAGLYGMSAALEAITRPLQWLASLIEMSTPVLKFFFQVISIGVAAVKGGIGIIASFVASLVGLADISVPSGGGFVKFIKDIASAVAKAVDGVSDLLQKGKSLTEAFSSVKISLPSMPSLPSLPNMPKVPEMPSLPSISGALGGAGEAADSGKSKITALTGSVKDLTDNMLGLRQASNETGETSLFNPGSMVEPEKMDAIGDGIKDATDNANMWKDRLMALLSSVGGMIGDLGGRIKEFASGFSGEDFIQAFNLAVLSTAMFTVIRFINALTKSLNGFGGVGEAFTGVLESAGGALDSFGKQAQAKLILNIAIAIGILALAMIALSFVPVDKLKNGLVALGALLFMVTITLKKLTSAVDEMDGDKIGTKMIGTSIAVMALGVAMLFLAGALLMMNRVDWMALLKGLIVMEGLIGIIERIGKITEDDAAKNMIAAAAAILAISGAMMLLAVALLMFKLVDWESMGKAGATLGVVSLAIGLLALLPAPSLWAVGKAMLATSTAMVALAVALLMFKFVSWESIGKLAVVLGALAITLGLMMAIGGPVAVSGMIGLGVGLLAIAAAGLMINKVKWETIGKIAALLGIMAVALLAFGAVASVVGTPLAILGAALLLIGAGVALFGLGIAVFVGAMGAAIALGAAGVAAFAAIATAAAVAVAVFLQTLAMEAPIMKEAFLKILQSLIDTIVEAVPMVIQGIKDLWAAIKKEIGGGAGKGGGEKGATMSSAGQSWISKLADGIKKKLPEIVKNAVEIVNAFLNGLASRAKQFSAAAVNLIVEFIKGVASKIGDIVQAAVELVIGFIKGIAKSAAKLARAAAEMIIDFVNDLADTIREKAPELANAAINLADAIIDGLVEGLTLAAGRAVDKIKEIAGNMIQAAKDKFSIFSPSRVFRSIGKFVVDGLTKGIQDNAAAAITATASMVGGQIAVANEYISKFIQKLDQQATAARARAQGLAAAAETAQKAANKTKTKTDDKAANRLSKRAKKAATEADAAERQAAAKKAAQDRAQEFKDADTLGKAKMKSEDAQKALDAVKAAERKAEAARVEANALIQQSKAAGVEAKQREKMRKEAKKLREESEAEAKRANALLLAARKNAAAALAYQKKAGAEAAAEFQKQFQDEAKSAKAAAAFDKLSDAEKAISKRKEAAALDAAAKRDLARAKKLAFTDIEAANKLAALAMDEAEAARQAIKDAENYENNIKTGVSTGTVTSSLIDLDPSAAAMAAFNEYRDTYDAAVAAAAAGKTVEFNQYNTSPESLSPSEVYRQTNNLLTHAADALQPSPQ